MMHFIFEVHIGAGYTAEQAEFCEVRVIGEFEDAEWVVEPGNRA
jgi:hypothetical protein